MAKEFYTSDGVREDLAQEVKLSTILEKGYAFPQIFPIVLQREKGGKFSFAPLGATLEKGTKDRAHSATLTAGEIAPLNLDWTVGRVEGRTRVFEAEVKGLGGIENCDRFGGEDSARRSMNSVENDAYSKVFSATRKSAAVELADHAVVKGLQKSALAVRHCGKPYLVMSTNAWLKFCDIPEIRVRLATASGATGDLGFMTLADAKVRQIVSTLLMFEGVILFDAEVVGDTNDGYIAVVAIRDEAKKGGEQAAMAMKGRACYSVAMVYLPDEANPECPFTISSHADRGIKANIYDSEGWLSLNELHATGGVNVVKFAAEYTEYTAVTVVTPPATP